MIALGPIDMSQVDELLELRGAEVSANDGRRIGTVEQIWVDGVNGLPEWAEVRIGSRRATRHVPLRAADMADGGITVNYTADEVGSAPEFDPETADDDAVQALYRHYRQPLPAPPPPQVRNPFDRNTARWVPGTDERIREILSRHEG